MNRTILVILGCFFGFFIGFGMKTNIWGYIGIGSFVMFGLLFIKFFKDEYK